MRNAAKRHEHVVPERVKVFGLDHRVPNRQYIVVDPGQGRREFS